MPATFLDTSAQAVKVFYHEKFKQPLDSILKSSDEVIVSRYSWYEFYHTWIEDLVRIFQAASQANEDGEIEQLLGVSRDTDASTMLMLGYLRRLGQDGNDPSMIACRARMLLEYELRDSYEELPNGGLIKEVDELNCTILNSYEEQSIMEEVDEVVSATFPLPPCCSREKAECKIRGFVRSNRSEFDIAAEAQKSLISTQQDSAFIKGHGDIGTDEARAKGRNCGRISDWLMIMHSPKDAKIITTDKDWLNICTSLGRDVVKLEIKPLYDKIKYKKKMSGEN